ncbi:MAG: 1-(5-phosphoribosyl)-5-((5-phosphoribosylamino)methylideneamino)imidazole-4-carboxamide isomerase [Gammaproteobacteria bacterium]|nr:1-(5-phosphoribosyl)-5-((5-phosphoribosylamino)methylideneamino)imidazole-4-carboxamide isomerase [Gammaproteobacteria bacterium]|tara:strand:- start:1637 stop:2014 length:378 start_codon:yes stop_codon:yes gene_type:complete
MRRPKNITYHQKDRNLELTYEDFSWKIAAELLRVFSPSAEVRGHGPHERKIQAGKKYIAIKRIDPVGNYAIRITFDDGHDTGLYSWDFLYDLGENEEEYWDRYYSELEQNNASRLPTISVQQWSP